MAINWNVQVHADPIDARKAVQDALEQGMPTVIFDRAAKQHSWQISGVDLLPAEQVEDVAFIDLATVERVGAIHILEPETLDRDLTLLARSICAWLNCEQGKIKEFGLAKHVGRLEEKLAVLDFMVDLCFAKKPEKTIKTLGGIKGVKAWRKFLRALGQGLGSLIFEDPWFSSLFLLGRASVIPMDKPLLLAPLYSHLFPKNIAAKVFRSVLDRTIALRAVQKDSPALNIFLASAEDLAADVENTMNELAGLYNTAAGRLEITLHKIPDCEPNREDAGEYSHKIWTLSRLKYCMDCSMLQAEWRNISGWPSNIKQFDYWGNLHGIMYKSQFYSVPKKDEEAPAAIQEVFEAGFRLGCSAPPFELPDEL